MTDATETCPFKIGDLVRVTRRNVEWEGWMPSMDRYVGAVNTIRDISFRDGRGYALIDIWYFPVEVLKKADSPEDRT